MTSSQPARPLRVLLAGLIAGGSDGVPRYAAALFRALDRVCEEFPDLRLSLLTTPAGAEAVAPRRLALAPVTALGGMADRGPVRLVTEQVALSLRAADLVHFVDLSSPVLTPWRPFTTTVHDAVLAQGYDRAGFAYKRVLCPWSIRRARSVVAVSGFARDEAVRHFGADARRVHVVHSGPGLSSAPGPPAGSVHEGGHLLYVGTLTASKNVPLLIRAYTRADVALPLLLVGRPGDGFAEITEAVSASPRRDSIRLVHGASDADLERLYSGATAFLFSSRYEGFGFTPLEAMSRGCPVLAGDIPAVREVSGGGCMLLPLDDEPAWAGAIRRVVAEPELRQALRARGERQVAGYSWERTARAVCRLLLAADPRPGGGGARASGPDGQRAAER